MVLLTVMAVVISGIALAVFNALLGGDATFKQVFAVVVHSGCHRARSSSSSCRSTTSASR